MKTAFVLSLVALISYQVDAQNIVNTLPSNGTFSVKDATTTFFSIAQTDGHISLSEDLANGENGFIFKGDNRFIHNYFETGTNGCNTFVGLMSGNFTMAGNTFLASYNTGIGFSSLSGLTSGYENSCLGNYALHANTTGYDNSGLGNKALSNNTEGHHNSASGSQSLYSNTSGSYNSAYGSDALYSNTTSNNNSAFGYHALYTLESNSNNCAFGAYALQANTAPGNSAFGTYSLILNTTGYNNCAFGYYTLNNSNGNENSAFGCAALGSNTTGRKNCAFGSNTLSLNVTGNENCAFGEGSMGNNIGSRNSAFGEGTLMYNSSGCLNVAVGYEAGINTTTGSNVICIGSYSMASDDDVNNEITLGNSDISSLRCNVSSISSLSDARDKKNIKDLPLGLDFLMNIKPRLYNWDKREWYDDKKPNGSKMQQTPTAGFIAQELDEAQKNADAEWLSLVLKSNPEKLEATPGNLLPIIVKAIQELKIENEKSIEILKLENEKLKSDILQLQKFISSYNTKEKQETAFLSINN